MAWTIEFLTSAAKQFKKLDPPIQKRILQYLRERIAEAEDPRQHGKPLSGDQAGRLRYRIGDYRLICQIEDERLTVLVLTVGHRREVYQK